MTLHHRSFPQPFDNFYDRPFWDFVRNHEFRLQTCTECGTAQFPAGPICATCMSAELEWRKASGLGVVESWVVFHRTYFEAYTSPYNVVLVQLDEGPLFVTNILPLETDSIEFRQRVRIVFDEPASGVVLPRLVNYQE